MDYFLSAPGAGFLSFFVCFIDFAIVLGQKMRIFAPHSTIDWFNE